MPSFAGSSGRRLVSALTAIAVVGAVLAAAGGLLLAGSGRAEAATSVPYTDPVAVGFVTLYDRNGNVLTHGNINDQPFAWAATGSAPAPKGYGIAGRTATLTAFNVINNVPPSSWDGDQMTSSTGYADVAHPTAYGTLQDLSLAQWMTEYPSPYHGFVELRLQLGAPNLSTLTASYDASDIQITGDTWQFVRADGPDGAGKSTPPVDPNVRVIAPGAAAANAAAGAAGSSAPAGAAASSVTSGSAAAAPSAAAASSVRPRVPALVIGGLSAGAPTFAASGPSESSGSSSRSVAGPGAIGAIAVAASGTAVVMTARRRNSGRMKHAVLQ